MGRKEAQLKSPAVTGMLAGTVYATEVSGVCVNVRGVSVRHSERQALGGGRKREREWGERET